MVSRIIPMNSRVVEGPFVLLAAMGIPRFVKVKRMLFKPCWHSKFRGGEDEAGSMIKKSSRI